ncbi:hypothetical protein HYS82_00435 [Candidatus Amesbacteria bacterium]|nr:hypothetical protein [Candidatus Amesbacteria bacterium]
MNLEAEIRQILAEQAAETQAQQNRIASFEAERKTALDNISIRAGLNALLNEASRAVRGRVTFADWPPVWGRTDPDLDPKNWSRHYKVIWNETPGDHLYFEAEIQADGSICINGNSFPINASRQEIANPIKEAVRHPRGSHTDLSP